MVFHLGMSGQLADQSLRARRSTTICCWRPMTARLALNDPRRFGSVDLVRTDELARMAGVQGAWARAARHHAAGIEAAARRPKRGRSNCCCSTSASSPASATSMFARRYTAPASIPTRAGRLDLARAAEAAGPGDPRRACRSDRCRRIDACGLRLSRRRARLFLEELLRSTIAKASRAPAAGRSSASSRAADRPSTVRAASVDLDRSRCRLGERRFGASLRAAPFFIELEDYNGEYAAGQKAHPPQRDARRRSITRGSAGSGPSSRPSSWRSSRARRRKPPRR